MLQRLQVFHVGPSSLAGRRSSHAAGRICVGRAPGNDVQFDAHQDRLVSAQHLAVQVAPDGRVVVQDLGATNGTFLDGVQVRGSAPVPRGARLECGRGGPVLVVWVGGDEEPPPVRLEAAVRGGAMVPPVQPSPVEPPRRNFAARFGEQGSPPEPSAPAPAPVRVPPPRIPDPPPYRAGQPAIPPATPLRPPVAAPAPPKEGVGRNTVLDLLGAHRTRERRARVVTIGLVTLLCGGVAVFAVLRSGKGERTVERVERLIPVDRPLPPPPMAGVQAVTLPQPDWPRVMKSLRERVYLVMTVDPATRSESKRGTAWSLDAAQGLLATNAHVAELFDEKEPAEILIARSSGSPPVDLQIERVELHPGYESFATDFSRLQPLSDAGGGFRSLVNPYDVAVMHVRAADVGNQAPALPLASRATLMALQGGEDLAYAGFPLEGQIGGGTDKDRPACNSNRFALSRATDPFFARPERPEEAHVLTYSMIITGGASGSPVVNAAGEVIGLVSAGNFVGRSRGARIMGGGICYGPRVDLVGELMSGTATEFAAARAVRDRRELHRAWEDSKPTDQRLLHAAAYVLKYDRAKDASEIQLVDHEIITASLSRPAEYEARVPQSGEYGLLFASMDAPTRLSVDVEGETRDVGSWYWVLPFGVEQEAGGSVRTRARLHPETADQSSGRVLFALYRVVP